MKEKVKKYAVEILTVVILVIITAIILGVSRYFNIPEIKELNTFPMEIIERNFLKKVKLILIYSIINILIGVLVLTLFGNYIAETYYIILFLVNVAIIFYYTYEINRVFTINTYVDNYF